MLSQPNFHTCHGHIRLIEANDVDELLSYYTRNCTHRAPCIEFMFRGLG